MQAAEIALILLPERSTEVEQLGGGLEIVPDIAAAVQDRHQAVPSGPFDRLRRRDPGLFELPERVLHDGLGDPGAEEDRSKEPAEDIARTSRIEVDAQFPGEPAARRFDDARRIHIIYDPRG